MSPTKLQKRDRAALHELEKDGRIQKADVVNAARPKSSPLHRHFEWSDKRCGELYRLEQAQTVIQSYTDNAVIDDIVIQLPHYIRDCDKASNEPGYVALDKVQEDRRMGIVSLQSEADRVKSSLSRARAIASALGMRAELERMLEDVLLTIERLRKAA